MFVPSNNMELRTSNSIGSSREPGVPVALANLEPGTYQVFRLCPADAGDFSYTEHFSFVQIRSDGVINLSDPRLGSMAGEGKSFTFRINEPEWIVVDDLQLTGDRAQGLNRSGDGIDYVSPDKLIEGRVAELQWEDLRLGEGLYATGMRGGYGAIVCLFPRFCIVKSSYKSIIGNGCEEMLTIIHRDHLGDALNLHLYALDRVNAILNERNASANTSGSVSARVVGELFGRKWEGSDDEFFNLLGDADELAYKCGQARMYARAYMARKYDWGTLRDTEQWLKPWAPGLGRDLVDNAFKDLEGVRCPKVQQGRDVPDGDLTDLFGSSATGFTSSSKWSSSNADPMLESERCSRGNSIPEIEMDSEPEGGAGEFRMLDPDDENDPIFGRKAMDDLGDKLSAFFGIGKK